jgi:hypothetical protein
LKLPDDISVFKLEIHPEMKPGDFIIYLDKDFQLLRNELNRRGMLFRIETKAIVVDGDTIRFARILSTNAVLENKPPDPLVVVE